MHRRAFLKTVMGCAGGAMGLMAKSSDSYAVGVTKKTVVNVTLEGGPDFRHLFTPPYDSNPQSFGFQYWKARANSHAISDTTSVLQQRWGNDYFHVAHGGVEFGILKKCTWLKTMWDQGNVAILNNVVGAQTRDHVHAQLVLDQANVRSGPLDTERSGWGGRLAAVAGGNVVSLTAHPRRFCYGPNPLNVNAYLNRNLIDMADTRNAGFYRPPGGMLDKSAEVVMTRSLEAYYAAKTSEMPAKSVYRRFIDMYGLRSLGDAVTERLRSVPVPSPIALLYQNSTAALSDRYFAYQIRNLYDSLICQDILDMRVVSLELPGWDTHRNQKARIEPLFTDMFGANKAMDTVYKLIPSDIQENLVFVIAGEFGRQLKANGDGGTDHGRGTSVLVIGKSVRGGLYGDMFPESELDALQEPSPDITGRTEYDHAFGPIVDWLAPGKALSVFPNTATAIHESGVDFYRLFT